MNIYDVGVENLPNIYISGIELTKTLVGSKHNYDVRVTCMIKEHGPPSTELGAATGLYAADVRSWKNRSDIYNMKVKVALLSSEDMDYQQIKSGFKTGTDSLFNYAPSAGVLASHRMLVDVKPAADFTEVQLDEDYSDAIGDIGSGDNFHGFYPQVGFVRNFNFTKQIAADKDIDLYVYAATFMDDLNFGVEIFDKYYGPMSSEIIMVTGEINKDSGYFYFPEISTDAKVSNREYGGPVHGHDGLYMEGSEHRTSPHYPLVYVPEPNMKINFIDHTAFMPTGIAQVRSKEAEEEAEENGSLDGDVLDQSSTSQTYT